MWWPTKYFGSIDSPQLSSLVGDDCEADVEEGLERNPLEVWEVECLGQNHLSFIKLSLDHTLEPVGDNQLQILRLCVQ